MKEHNNSLAPSSTLTDEQKTPDTDDQERSRSQDRFWMIYSTIRERIALLEYVPGARLSEAKLAKEFGVSRTPLRAALNRLETEGLVESRHGVGTFVTIINMTELSEIYTLRKELAPLIATLSPIPPTKALIARIAALGSQCADIQTADRPKQAFAKANIDFFLALIVLVGNNALKEIMELLFYRTARMWPALTTDADILREALQFEKEIADTLEIMKTGDVDAISYLNRTHISLAFHRLEKYRKD